jgi:hypothetical protein
VNVGGVVVSLVFSLLLLPSLMRLWFPAQRQESVAPPRGQRPRAITHEAEAA